MTSMIDTALEELEAQIRHGYPDDQIWDWYSSLPNRQPLPGEMEAIWTAWVGLRQLRGEPAPVKGTPTAA